MFVAGVAASIFGGTGESPCLKSFETSISQKSARLRVLQPLVLDASGSPTAFAVPLGPSSESCSMDFQHAPSRLSNAFSAMGKLPGANLDQSMLALQFLLWGSPGRLPVLFGENRS